MDTNKVVELLSSLSYRPGWIFSARTVQPWEAMFHDMDRDTDVMFTMTCDTVDTDRDCARMGYPEKKRLDWDLPVTSSQFRDEGDLLRSVFDVLMSIETHESREFFRVKSNNYAAPFHPHREDGNKLWEYTS